MTLLWVGNVGDLIGLGFFVLMALLVIGGIVYSVIAERKRKAAWKEAAATMGFSFREEDASILSHLGRMKLFSKGHNHKARNVIRGEAGGIAIVITDYQYVTGSGKNRTTHNLTLCVLSSEVLALPHCFLRPQTRFFDFLGKLFGGQDINFNEDPDFSDAWILQGQRELAVRQAFGAPVRQFFMTLREKDMGKKIQFEAQDDTLVVNAGSRIKPAACQELMEIAFGVLKAFEAEAAS